MTELQNSSETLSPAAANLSLPLADEAATVALGTALGAALAGQSAFVALYLEGDLGAGKTTLSRGILRAFGHMGAVKSPTYTLVEIYSFNDRQLFHFDLYRLGDAEELEYMGIRDYFAPGNICLIEWPERGAGILPQPDLIVRLREDGDGRMAEINAQSELAQGILSLLVA